LSLREAALVLFGSWSAVPVALPGRVSRFGIDPPRARALSSLAQVLSVLRFVDLLQKSAGDPGLEGPMQLTGSQGRSRAIAIECALERALSGNGL
jgi:hypothetical protein